jgi:hypothetical protein
MLFTTHILVLTVFSCAASSPLFPEKTKVTGISSDIHFAEIKTESISFFHNDSIHSLNFRYSDGRKGLKPWIAPVLLVSGGTTIHFMKEARQKSSHFIQENHEYRGNIDDYGQYAPLATVYLLFATGIKGKNNFGNKTAIATKSFLLNGFITDQLKYRINETRPNGGVRSFPSGHTSKAFAFAHFMHREYGEVSPWYSIGAYACAATVGYMRVAKGAHWVSDVLMGAGIGIFSTELVYLTHQYKWDNQHLKRFDIFPFQLGNQKGVTVVYNF